MVSAGKPGGTRQLLLLTKILCIVTSAVTAQRSPHTGTNYLGDSSTLREIVSNIKFAGLGRVRIDQIISSIHTQNTLLVVKLQILKKTYIASTQYY